MIGTKQGGFSNVYAATVAIRAALIFIRKSVVEIVVSLNNSMKTKSTTIMFSPTVRQRLIEKAQKEGRPISEVVEEACLKQLEAESQTIEVETLQLRARG